MVSASDVKPDLTILADVAANVFAICLLILIALLATGTRQRAVAPVSPSGPVEAREAFDVVERTPLDGRGMVEHLRARLAVDGGLALDLLSGRIAVSLDGRPMASEGPDAVAAALRAADPRRPVRLYVFDASRYAAAVAALRASGRAFTEISVPRALRRVDGSGWSPAFAALAPRAGNVDAFRTGLADLLGGGTAPGRLGAAAASEGTPRASLLERLRDLFSIVAAVAVPLLGIVVVLMIEARERRRLAPA